MHWTKYPTEAAWGEEGLFCSHGRDSLVAIHGGRSSSSWWQQEHSSTCLPLRLANWEVRRKWDMPIVLLSCSFSLYFCQQSPVPKRFHDFPKSLEQLGTPCLSTWASGGHLTSKLRQPHCGVWRWELWSLLPLRESWGLNSGPHIWQQALLSIEPLCQSTTFFWEKKKV